MKRFKIIFLIITITFLISCFQPESEFTQDYSSTSVYVLVPKNCNSSMISALNENNFKQGHNYFYHEFLGAGDAYSDLIGFIEIAQTSSTSRQQVLDMTSILKSNCYPNGFYGIPRDGNEWSELAKEISFLERNGVFIYAVKIKHDMIQIHIDFQEYRKVKEKGAV